MGCSPNGKALCGGSPLPCCGLGARSSCGLRPCKLLEGLVTSLASRLRRVSGLGLVQGSRVSPFGVSLLLWSCAWVLCSVRAVRFSVREPARVLVVYQSPCWFSVCQHSNRFGRLTSRIVAMLAPSPPGLVVRLRPPVRFGSLSNSSSGASQGRRCGRTECRTTLHK